MNGYIDQVVKIVTVENNTITGTLVGVDSTLNLILRKATECIDGVEAEVGLCIVRGDSVGLIGTMHSGGEIATENI